VFRRTVSPNSIRCARGLTSAYRRSRAAVARYRGGQAARWSPRPGAPGPDTLGPGVLGAAGAPEHGVPPLGEPLWLVGLVLTLGVIVMSLRQGGQALPPQPPAPPWRPRW
jgi:hypothetical protein